MAGRRAAPKPAEPEVPKRRRHQKKLTHESVPARSTGRTEKDVIKLINCLAEWTRDLRAARSASPSVTPRSSGPRSHPRRRGSSVSGTPSYPRGNPLTESMEFTDRAGTVWLAYIEGAEPATSRPSSTVTVLPERHLRFDSTTASRFTSRVPAGSPFLAEARLQSLLDEARSELPLPSTSSSARAVRPRSRAIEWSGRAIESSRGAIADWSRRWRGTTSRRRALRRHLSDLAAGAVHSMHGLVEVVLGRRPARL
jgi:hypothetical protein